MTYQNEIKRVGSQNCEPPRLFIFPFFEINIVTQNTFWKWFSFPFYFDATQSSQNVNLWIVYFLSVKMGHYL